MDETNIPPEESEQQSDARGDGRTPAWLSHIGLWIFGMTSGVLLRVLGATWRIEIIGLDPRQPTRGQSAESSSADGSLKSPGKAHLAALFHESMLPCAWLFRDLSYSVAVSRSRDGDLIRATLVSLGYREPTRGSSSRGGSAALRGLVRQFGEGTTVSVLVDGPRGPARTAKTGIVSVARLADAPIQPVAFSARPAIRLRSWDQSLIPLPFARVVCAFGEPLFTEAGADDASEQAAAKRLDQVLVALHHQADRVLLSR